MPKQKNGSPRSNYLTIIFLLIFSDPMRSTPNDQSNKIAPAEVKNCYIIVIPDVSSDSADTDANSNRDTGNLPKCVGGTHI